MELVPVRCIGLVNPGNSNVRGDVFGLRRWYILTFIMGAIFVAGQAYEYVHLVNHGTTISSTAYGSVFYMATGFHGFHVFIGLLWCAGLLLEALKERFSPTNYMRIEIFGLYWHYVDVVWIILFTIIYLI